MGRGPQARWSTVRSWLRRHPAAVTLTGGVVVAAALVLGLSGKRDEFGAALHAAPIWILAIAVLLHVCWLVARSEA